uniref:Phospholipid-transporting ATPase n=1 Tax=Crocodylus porosus TaxID=8502 RepID=A0A7M4EP88_CROPO
MAQCLPTFPDFSWEVRANDRAYHMQFKKRVSFCLTKRKYADNAIKTGKYNALTFLPLNLYEQFHRMANLYFLFVILLQVRSCWREAGDSWACQASTRLWACGAERFLPALGHPGKVTCEEPNSRMHSFIGMLEWKGEKYSLDSEKILLRGCRIRNTEICYGLVIYAGFDSKIMRNCGKIQLKKTKLDRMMDKLVILVFLVLMIASFFLAVACGIWAEKFRQDHSYLSTFYAKTSPIEQAFFTFWGFVILLSIIIPMSMYITLEFIYLVNSFFIDWDVEMYYPAKDTPAKARSTSLNDQLGQIEYIFSDKTGTLTQNIMTFKKCCINGIIYGNLHQKRVSLNLNEADFVWNPYADKNLEFYNPLLLEAVRQDDNPVVREFLRLLAICHTVMVEEKDSQLVYQAASPDEEALVMAARNLGYVFLSRTQDTITVSELGVKRTYQVLAMLDFNSVRKRMSILVRDPDGKIRLYSKGADMVILTRLHENGANEKITEKALDSFAEETLRTLCLASKEVKEKDYTEWSKKHHKASIMLENRAQELDKVYEEIEKDLKLLGATAIEDKLQDGVPETIQLLKKGNIKVWVLTGDKQETAMNIGFAYVRVSFLSSPVPLLSLKDKILCTGEVVKKKKENFWKRMLCCKVEVQQEQESLLEKAFMNLATSCQAVICCRVTPKQKSLIVQLVKKHKNAITLAIGDGANDVNMIKTADIGVGISGQEGMQAVQCSDYALAQFRFLQRLLLVHGRWSYLRVCKFLRYFFYKTFSGLMSQIWFAFYNGFTAQPLYEGWFLALYNVFYTAYPVLSMGLLEQDVSAKKSLQFPELYRMGQRDEFFNYRIFCLTLLHGTATSLGSFYIALWAFEDKVGSKVVGDYESFAVTVATSALLSVITEVSWVLLTCQRGREYASKNALTDPYVLLIILLSVVANTIPSLTFRFVRVIMGKSTIHQVSAALAELRAHFQRGSMQRRSSYAFSHKEGYADLITRGASLRGRDSLGLSATPVPVFRSKKRKIGDAAPQTVHAVQG